MRKGTTIKIKLTNDEFLRLMEGMLCVYARGNRSFGSRAEYYFLTKHSDNTDVQAGVMMKKENT